MVRGRQGTRLGRENSRSEQESQRRVGNRRCPCGRRGTGGGWARRALPRAVSLQGAPIRAWCCRERRQRLGGWLSPWPEQPPDHFSGDIYSDPLALSIWVRLFERQQERRSTGRFQAPGSVLRLFFSLPHYSCGKPARTSPWWQQLSPNLPAWACVCSCASTAPSPGSSRLLAPPLPPQYLPLFSLCRG